MEEINKCHPTVVVFTDTTLEVSNNAGNQAVETELTKPRVYKVRHKCEFTLMWNQGDFGYELPTRLRTSYSLLDVPAGGTGVRTHVHFTSLFRRHEGYSVVPSVEGNAKRRLVATRHAKCNHRCEIHDGYSTEQTITNSVCRTVPVRTDYMNHSPDFPRLRDPDPFHCGIHGDGKLDSVCAANRTDGISVKQEHNYPYKEN